MGLACCSDVNASNYMFVALDAKTIATEARSRALAGCACEAIAEARRRDGASATARFLPRVDPAAQPALESDSRGERSTRWESTALR